jgi:Leucine-rich repeat (LRR) protein
LNNQAVVHQRIEKAKKEQATELDLSNLDLTVLPNELGQLTYLKKLNLSKNNLQVLSGVIGKLKKLEFLNLWSNSLNNLPAEIEQLKALNEIDLEDNYFVEFPKSLLKLPKLRVIDLEHNGITNLPDEIRELTNLVDLDISRNRIATISDSIGQLSQLKVLNLKGNLLTNLPNAICNLSNLTWLNVSGNALDDDLLEATQQGQNAIAEYFIQQIIQDKILTAKAASLTKLDLSNHNISELPEELYQLDQLKILSLERNNIWEIPSKILSMKSLEVLDMSHNQLVSIPSFISKLPNLKVFETDGNPLKGSGVFPKVEYQREEVKKRIEQVKKEHSEILNLTNCGLTSIPKEVFQLSWLKTLVLGKSYTDKETIKHRNYIAEISPDIKQLNHLRILDLSGNALAMLPIEIEALSHLNTLVLHQNQFRKIPSVVYKLRFNLKQLDFSANKLSSVPRQIEQLKNLADLDLSYNDLDVIPDSMATLTNLRNFDCSNNRIRKLTEGFNDAMQLEFFNGAYNALETLPSTIGQLKNIKNLNLSNNKIKEIPSELLGWRLELVELNLINNQLRTLPDSFKQLAKLKKIHLGKNQLKSVPEALLALPKLERLSLINNRITKIPEGILHMKSLNYLDIKNNSLDKSLNKPTQKGLKGIREWFLYQQALAKVTQAKTHKQAVLDISNFGLRIIPKEVFELVDLKVLIIGRDYTKEEDKSLQNNINDIPKNILKLAKLEELYATSNNVSVLIKEIDQLKELRILDVANNSIKELPNSIGRLKKLEYLNLNYNQLKGLPFELSNISTLKEVHWNFNPFQSPFKEITELDLRSMMFWMAEQLVESKIKEAKAKNYSTLDLSNACLKELPKSLFGLTKLKKLNLTNNCLYDLPEQISNLNNLESLQLNDNHLEELPLSLTGMKRLKQLFLDNNPLSKLPTNVVEQGFYGIKQWMVQQAFNEEIDAILLEEKKNGHNTPLYSKHEVVCQVCYSSKSLSGTSEYIDVQFYNNVCYGCNGAGVIGYDAERIHAIIHKSKHSLFDVKKQLENTIKQKKSFEQSILFTHASNRDVVNHQVRKGFQGILERYNKQLELSVKRFQFYKDVQKRLHALLYNQYLLYCTLDEFRKLDSLDTGLSLNYNEKANLQKELITEVNVLNDFVANSNGLAIPADFIEDVGMLAERYQAML